MISECKIFKEIAEGGQKKFIWLNILILEKLLLNEEK